MHQIHTNIGNPQAVAYAVGKTYTEASSNAEQIIQAVNTHKDILTALMILVAECEAEIKAGIVSKKIFAMQNAKEAIKNTTGYEK